MERPKLTDRMNSKIYSGTHNLVPPVYGTDEVYRVIPVPRSAKGMYEGGIGCKVCLYCVSLLKRT
jgi:hypothetical protein